MNYRAESSSQKVVAPLYLLLPVIVFLFTACGAPTSGKMSQLSPNSSTESLMDQTPTPRAGQAIKHLSDRQNNSAILPLADPVYGKQLFNTFQPAAGIACATCHRVDSEERLVGPGLLNVVKRAETRVQGMHAVDYLRQSIVSPSAYVVDGYTDLMPKNWGRVFSNKQIDDLIAYLLTLKAG